MQKKDGDFENHLIALNCNSPPEKACELRNRFKWVYTPKHGNWLTMAEIELNVLDGQCLKSRIDNIKIMRKEVNTWSKKRNDLNSFINWRLKTEDAKIKLKRLYPIVTNLT